jgi:hypothetical protein
MSSAEEEEGRKAGNASRELGGVGRRRCACLRVFCLSGGIFFFPFPNTCFSRARSRAFSHSQQPLHKQPSNMTMKRKSAAKTPTQRTSVHRTPERGRSLQEETPTAKSDQKAQLHTPKASLLNLPRRTDAFTAPESPYSRGGTTLPNYVHTSDSAVPPGALRCVCERKREWNE